MQLTFQAKTGKAFVPFLKRMMTRAIAELPRSPADLSFALVGDATMSRLHVQFLNIPGPTDVLTFELNRDAKGCVTAGEVIVCVPEARRQAKLRGTKIEHELLLYCLHGLLHLTGHDDLDDAAHRKMHRAEDRILTAIGIGPVYHAAKHAPPHPIRAKKKTKKKVGRRS